MYIQGEGQEKILLCKGGGGHYMKNKNIGGCQLNLVSKKRPQCKNAQKCAKNYQTLKKFSSIFFFSFSKQSSWYEPFTSFISFS